MQYNITHTFKKGEVGKLIEVTLRDAAGLIDLTSYTMTMSLAKGGTVVVNDVAMTKRDQTTLRGQCYHTLTSTTANIAVGTYKGEVKATSGSNVLYFPCDKSGDRTYFTVIVQNPLE